MDADDLVKLLRERVKAEGGIFKFVENHDISLGYVGSVLYCGSKPGPKIALALGLKKVVSFEPIKG
jgi:hypothetical protein